MQYPEATLSPARSTIKAHSEEAEMNTNDMDRYYWRTGQRWSGDYRQDSGPRVRLPRRVLLVLGVAAVATFLREFWMYVHH
jgi:hypothetical protein